MKRDAYNKVANYFDAVPDYDGIKKKIKIHYLIFYNGMAGNELVIFKTKTKLNEYKKTVKNKIVTEGSTAFNLQLIHEEKDKSIYKEYLNNWIELFRLIEEDQIINKESFHWTYRTYNFNWRTLIIYARTELDKFKSNNKEIFDLYFHSIDIIDMDDLIMDEITQIKLIENTVNHIEKIIKKVHFIELETNLDNSNDQNIDFKNQKLETLNQIFNYRHPVSNRNVPWTRGIKVHYNSKKKRYNVSVEVLPKEPYSSSYNTAPLSPKEHFEKDYEVENITTEIYFQKLGTIRYPLYQKYIFPFYKTSNCRQYIEIELDEFRDEYSYNKLYHPQNFELYNERLKFILSRFERTKQELERVLKPFNPSKYDEKFKDYINSLVENKDELWHMPWCRYQYHDHEIVHCFEEHHKYLEKAISIFQKLLKTKNPESIKFNYSQFDELFKKVDSSFVLAMLQELGITNGKEFILNKKKYGAFRGVVEALKESGLMNKENLIIDIRTFARNFKVTIKKPLNTTEVSELYRNKTKDYLIQAGFKKNQQHIKTNQSI